jgi:hypothetical protein
MATKMTSIRKMIVVSSAANRPSPRVRKDAPRETPAPRRRTMKSDARRVKKAKPHAEKFRRQSVSSQNRNK